MRCRASRLFVAIGVCSVAAIACGGPPPGPPVPAPTAWTPERNELADALARELEPLAEQGAVAVHLAFGADVDLDLYVTGPRDETVYYANSPSKIGGALVEDRRCAHAGVRVETVRFGLRVPGRYRIGVDYPHACGEARAPAPFALRVDTPAGRLAHRAIAAYHVFEPVVLEFDVGATDAVVTSESEDLP